MTEPLKGLVLAAGRGTRLSPLTDRRSKPLVKLANKPLIEYSLDKLVGAGIDDIGIVVGSNEQELRASLCDYPASLSFHRQEQPLGLAHAVNAARTFCADSSFVLLFCDNLFLDPLSSAVTAWNDLRGSDNPPEALIHTVAIPDPSACGVAVVDSVGDVLELEEKPPHPKSNLAVVGIDFFTPLIFEMIARIKPSKRGEYEITDAIAELIATGHRVSARSLPGFWFDTGTFKDLLLAQAPVMQHLHEAQVHGVMDGCTFQDGAKPWIQLGAGSVLRDCQISGPLMVGQDCVVEHSRLGPNVCIESGSLVANSTLADVLLTENSSVESTHRSACLLVDGEWISA